MQISFNHGLAFRFQSLLPQVIMDRLGGLAKFLRFHSQQSCCIRRFYPRVQRLFFRVNGDPFVQRHASKTGAVQKDHGSGNENGHFQGASIRPLFENEA